MNDHLLEMRFDPQTINHLGLRMYSTLPPAIAEIVSNAYDADAENVTIILIEENESPKEIKIIDDGIGLTFSDIQSKFLVIGRNRRAGGDLPTERFSRLPTGKKGLGKLALFGLAETITICTVHDNILNEFVLDWKELMAAKTSYYPKATVIDKNVSQKNGTTISLTNLKRKSSFDFPGLADSLSRIFIFDENFNLVIESPQGDKIRIDNKRKYKILDREFDWSLTSTLLVPENSEYHGKLGGELITSTKPIAPSSGLRGITLYSRGKLVNAPEFFASSTSSHFYQYLTGWITADFIDLFEEDVISTNRQAIDWDHPKMSELRVFLSGIVAQVNSDWRKRRKEKKEEELKKLTGIDTARWTSTMPDDIKVNVSRIIEALSGESAFEKYTPVLKAFHEVVPDYPLLHWRYLHEEVKTVSKQYYYDKNYYTAFLEALKKYVKQVMEKSEKHDLSERDLMAKVFKLQGTILDVIRAYKQSDGSDFSANTKQNVQEAQQYLSQGIIIGGRHPLSHEEIDELRYSDLFSEKDCLDMLSLLSHLFKRLDNSIKVS